MSRDPFLKLKEDHLYLKKRGLKKDTIEYFGLGYCERGLLKGRIAIPIHNEKGQLIAYAGRVVDDKEIGVENPKYKIPANFKKSLVVFNLHRVIEESKQLPLELILVEGFFDCFKVWQAGFRNVVALMGNWMSEEQEALIVKTVGSQGKVTLILDGDKAGREGSEDIIKRLISQVYLKAIFLKEGQEPDNLKEEEIKKLLG